MKRNGPSEDRCPAAGWRVSTACAAGGQAICPVCCATVAVVSERGTGGQVRITNHDDARNGHDLYTVGMAS